MVSYIEQFRTMPDKLRARFNKAKRAYLLLAGSAAIADEVSREQAEIFGLKTAPVDEADRLWRHKDVARSAYPIGPKNKRM